MQPDTRMLNMTTREKFLKGKNKGKKSVPGLDQAHDRFSKQTMRTPDNHPKRAGIQ